MRLWLACVAISSRAGRLRLRRGSHSAYGHTYIYICKHRYIYINLHYDIVMSDCSPTGLPSSASARRVAEQGNGVGPLVTSSRREEAANPLRCPGDQNRVGRTWHQARPWSRPARPGRGTDCVLAADFCDQQEAVAVTSGFAPASIACALAWAATG